MFLIFLLSVSNSTSWKNWVIFIDFSHVEKTSTQKKKIESLITNYGFNLKLIWIIVRRSSLIRILSLSFATLRSSSYCIRSYNSRMIYRAATMEEDKMRRRRQEETKKKREKIPFWSWHLQNFLSPPSLFVSVKIQKREKMTELISNL